MGLRKTLLLVARKLRRLTIQRHLLKRMVAETPCRIVIGAGGLCQDGWIPTDVEYLNLLKEDDWERYFAESSIDAMLAEHVWEHLTQEEGIRAGKVCFRYLKGSGYLRVAVPDGLHSDPAYIERVKPGGFGLGASDHKCLYDYRTFTDLFEACGFRVELLEYFDEQGEFHFKEWEPENGMIHRSMRFDRRNTSGKLVVTSLILDAWK